MPRTHSAHFRHLALRLNVLAITLLTYGNARAEFGFFDSRHAAVLVQTDQKIVVAGRGLGGYVIARYNTDGTLDGSFDGNGLAHVADGFVPFISRPKVPVSLALQGDGKVVLAGMSVDGLSLWRYLPNGSRDSSFGSNGKVHLQGHLGSSPGVLIQPNGSILLVASAGDSMNLALARYLDDGSLDPSLDGDGIATTAIGSFDFAPSGELGAYLQTDGKILVALPRGFDLTERPTLVRFNTDGSLDATFDGDGIVTTTAPAGYAAVVQQPGGKVIGLDPRGVVYRFNADGSPDSGFHSFGIEVQDYAAFGYGALAVQSDGSILVGGTVKHGVGVGFAVTRLLPDGALDLGFADDGTFFVLPAVNGGATAIAIGQDGTIVASGFDLDPRSRPYSLTTAKLDASGTPIAAFGDGGVVHESECRRVPVDSSECIDAERTKLTLRSGASSLRMGWKWRGVENALQYADLGNPNSETQYTFCMYDRSGADPSLVSWYSYSPGWLTRPPGRWSERGSLYGERIDTDIVAYTDGSPSVKISAACSGYLPRFPVPAPTSDQTYFNQNPSITVQLVNSDGLCVRSEIPASATTKNNAKQFSARTP